MRVVVRNEARPDISVPRSHHLEYRYRDYRRDGERKHYLPQILEVARTVDLCGEVQLVRDLQKRLPQEIDVIDRYEHRHDQYRKRVGYVEPAYRLFKERKSARYGEVVRNRVQFARYHHRSHQRAEHYAFAFELQSRERECGQHRDDQRQHR